MHWIYCGIILFGFAAPSAVVGVPYSIGTQGVVLGVLAAIIFTITTAIGSFFLVELAWKHKTVHEFKDIGAVVAPGLYGGTIASLVQIGNMLIFMSVAILIIADAAQGAIDPNFTICTDYFMFAVSGICFITTQFRSLGNTNIISTISLFCTIIIGVLIIYISIDNDNTDKKDVLLFGNPDIHTQKGFFKALLGCTTAAWSYVPGFIVIELMADVPRKRDMQCAIILSAVLNIIFYLSIGLIVVYRWGWEMEDPVTIVSAWPRESTLARVCSALLFVANLVSYALDSIPLTNKFINYLKIPNYNENDWSMYGFFQ
jgi:hypothetical protein